MAGPVAAITILPDSSGNLGKKIRTQTRVVSATTVNEHVYTFVRQAQVIGVYRATLAQQAIQASATNGTSTGFAWFHNPTATSNINCRIRKAWMSSSQVGTANTAMPTAPRVLLQRFSFTGTASGAAVTPDQIDSGSSAPVLSIRTAVTGLTVSLIGAISAVSAMTSMSATTPCFPISENIMLEQGSQEDSWEVLRPGEGIVLYQDVAGTSSDSRVFNFNILWDEQDVA